MAQHIESDELADFVRSTAPLALIEFGDTNLVVAVGEELSRRSQRRLRHIRSSAELEQLDLASASSPAPILVLDHSTLVASSTRSTLRRKGVSVVWVDDGTVSAERQNHLGLFTTMADAIVGGAVLTDVSSTCDSVMAALADAQNTAPTSGRSNHRQLQEQVALGDGRSYTVHVGRGCSSRLSETIADSVKRVAVVTQAGIGLEVDSGRDQRVFVVDDGEEAKRLEVVGRLASEFAQWGMTRGDAVVSVGGGVVSDLAGYVAASYHRGIPVIHVSTTLLGQIDAAIGGKCGVNLPEGKNLVGAFWQPSAVFCELAALDTLPEREFRSGMGELAKYHFLGGGQLDRLPLVDRVARSVRIKADVVASDEREGGRRAVLNYGHTMAHALETLGQYELRHGEAVGIGLIYAAELALRLGRIDEARVAEHRRVVSVYGLSTDLPSGYDIDQLIALFGRDKKAIDGTTFVLDGPNGVEPLLIEDDELLREAALALTPQGGRPK